MKPTIVFLLTLVATTTNAQLINKRYNESCNGKNFNNECEISANENSIYINVKVLYNAVPDGYHITFTKSFISNTLPNVELEMNTVIDNLTAKVKELDISKKDIAVDVISLDPIFDFNRNDTSLTMPNGYKITENITFNIKSLSTLRKLAQKCLEFGIYDLINAEAYILDSKIIYDSLSVKAIDILNMKKDFSTKIGWSFTDGKVTFSKLKDVIYPSERYLSSYITNGSLYKHNVSQNATLSLNREVEVDNYFNWNLKDADFVFHSNETNPVIQFYYQINYTYTKKDTEQEMREKIKEEETKKPENIFYILDKNGSFKKVDM